MLHYIIRLDNGKSWKWHIDQIQKVGNVSQRHKESEEIWDYPPETIEAPEEHKNQIEARPPQDHRDTIEVNKNVPQQIPQASREGGSEQGVSDRATPRKSIRNRALPKRYGNYIAH